MKASREGPAILPGIGRLGAGHCTIFSQQRQDFLSRATSITFNCAAIMSRIWLTSSPTRRRGPPHSAQVSPGSISRRSRGVSAETRGLRRGTDAGAVLSAGSRAETVSTLSSSGTAAISVWAICSPSSANSSCSISRATFSELAPNFCFLSRAICSLSAWIRRSWARKAPCNCRTKAFSAAGSSGRVTAA